jgi:hypothetical protein
MSWQQTWEKTMLNDISNRERFDILVEKFCIEIGLIDQMALIRNHQPFGADEMECRLEFNSSVDPDRGYIFVCSQSSDETISPENLTGAANDIEDGKCGYIHLEEDDRLFTVVPFSITETDVQALKSHLWTALDRAWALKESNAEQA